MRINTQRFVSTFASIVAVFIVPRLAVARAEPAIDAAPQIQVSADPRVAAVSPKGRLLLFFTRVKDPAAQSRPSSVPASGAAAAVLGPNPTYGLDVPAGALTNAAPMAVPADTRGYPGNLRDLPTGKYSLTGVLVTSNDRGNWEQSAGNLYSKSQEVVVGAGGVPAVALRLDQLTSDALPASTPSVEFVRLPSALLSKFEKRPVSIDVGIHWPAGVTPKNIADQKFPAIYEVPGFGGNHQMARRGFNIPGQQAFYVVVNPNNRNGHTLFADSPENGPWGAVLTTEIIPELERRFPLMPSRDARLLRGHSSGGWTVLWLITRYPEVFGAAWSTSPDPVDFHSLEMCNIYDWANMYADPSGKPLPAARRNGQVTATVAQENALEEVLSPGFTSGEQWSSWLSCWGGRGPGFKNLYNPATGAIDPAVAQSMRAYDLTDLLVKNPDRYLPIWRDRVFLAVGTADEFYLNEACMLLAAKLRSLTGSTAPDAPAGGNGHIIFVPGVGHGTIYGSEVMRKIPGQMGAWLAEHGTAVATSQPTAMPTAATRP